MKEQTHCEEPSVAVNNWNDQFYFEVAMDKLLSDLVNAKRGGTVPGIMAVTRLIFHCSSSNLISSVGHPQ